MNGLKKMNEQPIYAEIVEANDERTVAALVLFGKRVRREFRGPRHLTEARVWVASWADHLADEWDGVKETTAVIMGTFTAGLKRRGVGSAVIRDTIEEIVRNV